MHPAEKTRRTVEKAKQLGFDICGIAPAGKFPELAHLPVWLARGYAGEMRYLHNAKRESPERVLPGARSIIVCAMNYNTPFPYSTAARASASAAKGWISRYAWGRDYHEVLGERLEKLQSWMQSEFSEPHESRWYVDTGPLVERIAAKWAGLGWLGKNTCLINEHLGSWLFLGVIITTLDLTPSLQDSPAPEHTAKAAERFSTSHESQVTSHGLTPPPDLCGQCTLCIEACPTGALVEPYVMDARRCISYLTIEQRGPIPDEFREQLGWHIFGCDICQDVCPYNRKAPTTDNSEFFPRRFGSDARTESGSPGDSLFAPDLASLPAMNDESFQQFFAHSAIRRAKLAGLQRNINLALSPASQKRQK